MSISAYVSRIWIIFPHPWAALERPQWVFNAFLTDAPGTVQPRPNLLAHPHSSKTSSEAVLPHPLLKPDHLASFPALLSRRTGMKAAMGRPYL